MEHLPPALAPLTIAETSIPSRGYTESQAYRGPSEQPDNPDSRGLIEYWRILRRHQGTIVLITIIGVVVAILVSLPQTPIFRARTSVEIQDINNDFLNTRQVSPISEGGSAMNMLTDVQTQMKILQSENLIDRVIDGLKTEHKLGPLEPGPGRLDALREALKMPPPTPASVDYKLRRSALKALKVRQLGQTRIVEILYDSKDPAFAAEFANRLTSTFIESNMEARWKMTQHTGEWLSRQLDDMRVSLERSEDALQAYARKAGLLFTATGNNTEKSNVVEEKLRQVQEELSKAQADRVSAQSHYEIAKAAAPDTLAEVLNDQSLRELQQKVTDLRQQEADLITIYTPKNDKVKRVQAQIGPLERAVERERTDILDRIHNDYESAQRREKLLMADYISQSHVVTDQAEKSIQYNILKREAESNRQIYEAMLQQVKQASVASAMRASNVRVVDPAKPPFKPDSPDFVLNSLLGLFTGLLIGVASVIMRERSNQAIQQPGDMTSWLNVPELGVIPSATLETRRRIAYAKPQTESTNGHNGNRTGTDPNSPREVALITHHRKPSLIAESFRAVLTSILFSGENGSRPRVLVLTSASPVEGKTTLVSNLGIAMAEIGRRVLVIDADLRRPRMHELFELPNDRGLSTLLQARTYVPDSVNSVLHQTAIPDLFILPAGPSTHAAANLLYSGVFPDMLKALRKQFDTILIDTPPMLQMTDARVIGRLADAVILVTRAGKTTREAAIAAYQRFSEDKTRVLGTILNDWNPKMAPNGYYGYYNGYGHSYKNYNGYYARPEAK